MDVDPADYMGAPQVDLRAFYAVDPRGFLRARRRYRRTSQYTQDPLFYRAMRRQRRIEREPPRWGESIERLPNWRGLVPAHEQGIDTMPVHVTSEVDPATWKPANRAAFERMAAPFKTPDLDPYVQRFLHMTERIMAHPNAPAPLKTAVSAMKTYYEATGDDQGTRATIRALMTKRGNPQLPLERTGHPVLLHWPQRRGMLEPQLTEKEMEEIAKTPSYVSWLPESFTNLGVRYMQHQATRFLAHVPEAEPVLQHLVNAAARNHLIGRGGGKRPQRGGAEERGAPPAKKARNLRRPVEERAAAEDKAAPVLAEPAGNILMGPPNALLPEGPATLPDPSGKASMFSALPIEGQEVSGPLQRQLRKFASTPDTPALPWNPGQTPQPQTNPPKPPKTPTGYPGLGPHPHQPPGPPPPSVPVAPVSANSPIVETIPLKSDAIPFDSNAQHAFNRLNGKAGVKWGEILHGIENFAKGPQTSVEPLYDNKPLKPSPLPKAPMRNSGKEAVSGIYKEPPLRLQTEKEVESWVYNVLKGSIKITAKNLAAFYRSPVVSTFKRATVEGAAAALGLAAGSGIVGMLLTTLTGDGEKTGGAWETDETDLNKIMAPFAGKGFTGVIAADEIKTKVGPRVRDGNRTAFIMNTDPRSKPGRHWVGVLVDWDIRPAVHYYDPFGDKPSKATVRALRELVRERTITHPGQKPLKLKINGVANQRANASTCGLHSSRFLQDMLNGKSFVDATDYNTVEGEKAAKALAQGPQPFGYLV